MNNLKKNTINKKINYEDYSSGRVLYGAPGATSFPVRLSNEIFEWCDTYFISKNQRTPYRIYDPLCGTAYSLTVLGFLYGSKIKAIFASDRDKTMVEFARKNLSLLTLTGLENRTQELRNFIDEYDKDSHRDALKSALHLKNKIPKDITLQTFEYNILDATNLPPEITKINLVFADVPYGALTQWHGTQEGNNPIQLLLNNVKSCLDKYGLVVLAFNKKQAFTHDGYTRIKTFNKGLRKILILQPT
ncbi:hypothetical protein H0X48_06675 [Candidatus Dependentiae bacterium]|nr:hypothetical protein [Candidatus Dependentiae bacterium]